MTGDRTCVSCLVLVPHVTSCYLVTGDRMCVSCLVLVPHVRFVTSCSGDVESREDSGEVLEATSAQWPSFTLIIHTDPSH